MSRAALAFRFYVVRSVALDLQTLRMKRWPVRTRCRFLGSKAVAVARLLRGREATLMVGPTRVRLARLADLGTLQASLLDVHDELLSAGLLGTTRPNVVDVGANVGQFTTAVRTFFPGSTVTAFEPDPEVHAVLADNARRLGGVRTQALAMGESASLLPLYRHAISAMSTLRPGLVERYDPHNLVMVPVVRLDDVTSHLASVDLLKIDVEGFEVQVLKGATETLARTRLLLVEVSLGRTSEPTEPEVMAIVTSIRPSARVVRRGRLIGAQDAPMCQDVLVQLGP
jgi:FkbM family methyltransferase